MKVFNVINKEDVISLEYGETKTINFNIPNFETKRIFCIIKPGGTLNIITDFDYANQLYIFFYFPSGYSDITIKINEDNIPLSNNDVRYIEATAQGISLFSLTEITNE